MKSVFWQSFWANIATAIVFVVLGVLAVYFLQDTVTNWIKGAVIPGLGSTDTPGEAPRKMKRKA